jgi:hypothetical protein
MMLSQKKVWFKKAFIVLDDARIPVALKEGYSSIVAVSYAKFNLPGWSVREKTTALINLTDSEDALFKKFSDTTRNEINKTLKNTKCVPTLDVAGHTVGRDTDVFEKSFKLYSDFEYAQGRVPAQKNEMKKYHFFGILYEGDLISGMYVIASLDRLRIRSIFSKRLVTEDKEMYKIISNATRRVMWDICRWGKLNGFQSLDLASVNFTNPATASITKFKMSFGGDVIPEYTYTYKSRAFAFFEHFVSIKLVALKLLRVIKGKF